MLAVDSHDAISMWGQLVRRWEDRVRVLGPDLQLAGTTRLREHHSCTCRARPLAGRIHAPAVHDDDLDTILFRPLGAGDGGGCGCGDEAFLIPRGDHDRDPHAA